MSLARQRFRPGKGWCPLSHARTVNWETGRLEGFVREKAGSSADRRRWDCVQPEAASIPERGKAQVEVQRRLYAEVQTGGKGVSNALNQRVRGAYGTMEGLASVLGLDIQEVLQRAVGSGDADGAGASAPELPPG